MLVLLKTLCLGPSWTLAELATSVGLSVSETHAATRRLRASGLAGPGDTRPIRPNRAATEEFLIHGLRYAFPAALGEVTRGLVTASSAPPLAALLAPTGDLPTVWPDPDGETRGLAVTPLYRSAPEAARRDPRLHELLALVDALRLGRPRERNLASQELTRRLKGTIAA